ncbi:MAG: HAD family hydrolase [Candidatus Sungiibacteriota bacterium]
MKTKVVVLDWDGVLYDSAEIYVGHFNTVLGRYGKEPVTLLEFRERAKTTVKEFFELFGVDDVAEAERQFIDLTRQEPRPSIFPDTHDTLRWLHHRYIETHIVSAHPRKDIELLLAEYGLASFVTSVTGHASPKDKIGFIAGIIAARQINPSELVFVEDMDQTLRLASIVGCYRVASARGYCSYKRLLKAKPDRIIHNLKNLQGFINLIHHSQPQNLPDNSAIKKASGK